MKRWSIRLAALLAAFACGTARAATMPEEVRAVWIWGQTVSKQGAATVASKLKANGINTVMLLVKGRNGGCSWNSDVCLAPDRNDALATYTSTFRNYGIKCHLWFVFNRDDAWLAAHPDDCVYNYGKGGDPYPVPSGESYYVCPLSDYRAYFLAMIREVLSKPSRYPIDGIHLDYIRYGYAYYCFCPKHIAKGQSLGVNVSNVQTALATTYVDGSSSYYFNKYRNGDPDVTRWVRMREDEVKGVIDDVGALIREYQPGLTLSAALMAGGGGADPSAAICHYGQNYEQLGPSLDLICPMTYHERNSKPYTWCSDVATRAAERSGTRVLTGMAGEDSVASIIADSRARGGTCGYIIFRYGSLTTTNWSACAAADRDLAHLKDVDNNGRADLMMVNAAGNSGAWLVKAGNTVTWKPMSTMAAGYAVLDFGFTSRAKETADVFIYNATTGVVGAWVTNASGVSGWQTIGSFDPTSQVLGVGDFNGDGVSDLVLRSAGGDVGCYLGGTSTLSGGWHYFGGLGPEWSIAGIGDLNGDGFDDLVLAHQAGYTGAWLIQSLKPVWSDLGMLASTNRIVGCGDFDGDGTDDVLIGIGSVYGAWMVQDGSVTGWRDFGIFSGTVEDIADFNNDGIDDLRVRTPNGDLGYFTVPQGTGILNWTYFGSVGSEWTTSRLGL